MGINDLIDKGKQLIEDRGGADAIKEDADEVKNIATDKESSLADKGKDALEAIKDPGKAGPG